MDEAAEKNRLTGSCLCKGVSFEIRGTHDGVIACHCSQCRKSSGHFQAGVEIATDQLVVSSDDGLAWYRASEIATRGFCSTCGSSLFWKPYHGRYISVMAGALDHATGLRLEKHIFVADKGDYYEIGDGVPQERTPPRHSAQGSNQST
ncbi:MAG: GFA family protein [Rhodobacteraceae bacterium]|nr:GFA family protein [Paracoccaceae bacterium]MCY4139548.1 GFA family protein [Paracoccaceae bacterium]